MSFRGSRRAARAWRDGETPRGESAGEPSDKHGFPDIAAGALEHDGACHAVSPRAMKNAPRGEARFFCKKQVVQAASACSAALRRSLSSRESAIEVRTPRPTNSISP